MILFYLGLAIIFIGLASVAWLLFTEKKNNQPTEELARPLPKETPDQLLSRVGLADEIPGESAAPQKKSLFSGLLSKFKKNDETPSDTDSLETEPRMRITKDILQTGTASVRLATPVPNEAAAPPEEDLPAQISTHTDPGINEKNSKLEALLTEKSDALEKAEKALAVELKNKKEFNKIKDLLEKELKDDKVKYRDLQVQIGTAQMDANAYKNRVNQLELKVSKLEKTVTDMEHQLKERDEKIFDRETKLKELTEKLSAKEKLETIKVQAAPPPEPEPEPQASILEAPQPIAEAPQPLPEIPSPVPEAPPVEAPVEVPPEAAPAAVEIPIEPLPAVSEPYPLPPPGPETPALEMTPVEPEPPQKDSGGEAAGLKLPPDILVPNEPEPAHPQEEPKPEQNNPSQ